MTTGFKTEADLCSAFIASLPKGWTAYAETQGYDILLVRVEDGLQIGVEAKLRLNAEVVVQALEDWGYNAMAAAPDFRAALVPSTRCGKGFSEICSKLGITVIRMRHPDDEYGLRGWRPPAFAPDLPDKRLNEYWGGRERDWYDWCPATRLELPEYIPDVAAGASAPVALTQWKIRAIKLMIILERRGYVTKADFKHVQIDHSRWTRGWLEHGAERGQFVAGKYTPDLKAQHPVNWAQIEADFEKWKPAEGANA
ncbi:hypothetical protein [Mesorhizobium silamurunense]|uniref:hypothetical protein n=1 Tax=Mesorhizobium silamurunense TaxID=499528 RepID=UPI00177E7C46|nr:hypothetical protein [Mesorhizobium silamurunense]